MGIQVVVHGQGDLLAQLLVQPTQVEKIKESQQKDPQLLKITEEVKENAKLDFRVDEEGILSSGERVCVPIIRS